MDRRDLAYGALGWLAPGIVTLPLAFGDESAGGEAALFAVFAWWGLGVVGCVIAGIAVGARSRRSASRSDAFGSGLAGVAISWIAALVVAAVIEAVVKVLHLGPLTLLLPVPFVIGYAIGFALGVAAAGASEPAIIGVPAANDVRAGGSGGPPGADDAASVDEAAGDAFDRPVTGER